VRRLDMTDLDSLDHLRAADGTLAPRMPQLLAAPALLLLPERLLLYALVRGLRPRRALEIGTRFGGSAAIVCAALDDLHQESPDHDGRLVCVDAAPDIPAALWTTIAHRTSVVRGHSPAVLPEARAVAAGEFDFIFVDGDHRADGVTHDLAGVLAVAAPGATILCHDACHADVAAGIDEAIRRHPTSLIDGGLISTLATAPSRRQDGTTEHWGGLRLLRRAEAPRSVVDEQDEVTAGVRSR
jgi:predicted O-methyltransferase YrrM